jgi:hypothetical protein
MCLFTNRHRRLYMARSLSPWSRRHGIRRRSVQRRRKGIGPADLAGRAGGVFKAQAEGGKVFEALVKEGVNMQRKTQTVAEEKSPKPPSA